MFIDIDFPSLNRHTPPPPGTYRGDLRVFADDHLTAYIYLYTHDDSERVRVCDLLVRSTDGHTWVDDFVQLEDLNWRDSRGRCSPDLWSLMPEELRELPQARVEPLPEFEVTP